MRLAKVDMLGRGDTIMTMKSIARGILNPVPLSTISWNPLKSPALKTEKSGNPATTNYCEKNSENHVKARTDGFTRSVCKSMR